MDARQQATRSLFVLNIHYDFSPASSLFYKEHLFIHAKNKEFDVVLIIDWVYMYMIYLSMLGVGGMRW